MSWLPGMLLVALPLLGQERPDVRVVGFEDVVLESPPATAYGGPGGGVYYNGSDLAGGFISEGMAFVTEFTDFGGGFTSWSGWAYSTVGDRETAGFGNQYAAYPGGAREGAVHAVTFVPSSLMLPAGRRAPVSLSVANTTYAALSMRDGDDFAKPFGDDPATPDVVESDFPDYFKLTLTGLDPYGTPVGTAEVYLADYRGEGVGDGIAGDWIDVDLSGWGSDVTEITFSLESTDVGAFGMNTPAYLAVDRLVLGRSPLWAGYDLFGSGWVDTGSFLGLVYPVGNFVYLQLFGKYVYLPEAMAGEAEGSWVYFP